MASVGHCHGSHMGPMSSMAPMGPMGPMGLMGPMGPGPIWAHGPNSWIRGTNPWIRGDKSLDTRGQIPGYEDLGVWKQDLGVWKQDLGVWKQDLGVWKQDLGVWKQDLGVWDLGDPPHSYPPSWEGVYGTWYQFRAATGSPSPRSPGPGDCVGSHSILAAFRYV